MFKNNYIYFLSSLILICFISSCSKNNQGCINKLEGEWEEFSQDIFINGVPSNVIKNGTTSYIFNPYKDKDNGTGTATIKTVVNSTSMTENIEFQITKDCTEFWISTSDTTNLDDIRATINQISSKTFEFEYTEQSGVDVYRYVTVLNKQ